MRWTWFRAYAAGLALFVAAVPFADTAQAYIGPGAGISAIGSVLALLSALVLAAGVVVWYPFRRLLRRRRAAAGPGRSAPAPD